ncbi:unnamed protein product [Rotaria socialis]|uniref:Uncharacterized protein n=1 Tax=Rotaria socialis TaxID=392032 RepID=A0A821BQB4_9BILA|nr:unnamed protein product [Rotaria socialis]CAF3290559.1 unnamed protein product [Rotaria socialis]CAF3392570.1 unnamed protein product [Rotaria socialis]CAF3756918.1 unnamed protein product [Rotaria socialis]CAF3798613.1 unnamed protein product [Rotaria socialis]
MVSNVKIAFLLFMILFIHVGQAAFSRVPPPPISSKPLLTRDDLKHYLQKVHEYHSILGRWRLRRDFHKHLSTNALNDGFMKYYDNKNDHVKTNLKFPKTSK